MAGLSSIVNLGYHGTSPAIADAITTSGFKGGTVPTWAGTGKTFTTPNINVASTYGPRQIPIVQSAQHFKLPGGGIPGQTLTEAFKNIGKTKFGFETALSPEKATKGMTALERMKGKYPHSQTLQRLLKTGTTAITNPTNWARLLGLPLSALTGILSSTPVGSAEMPAYGSEEYKTLMAREAFFRKKQKQANVFKQMKQKQLADEAAKKKITTGGPPSITQTGSTGSGIFKDIKTSTLDYGPHTKPKKKYTPPSHQTGGSGGVHSGMKTTKTSAPQRNYSRHRAYGLKQGGIIDKPLMGRSRDI